MMTVEDLALLYELQQTDSAIDQREALLAGLDDGTLAGEALAAAEAALDEAEAELRKLQTHHRDLELKLKSIDQEKREKSDRAYGGMVSDPKELQALQRKIEELERNTGRVEDDILETLETVEQAQATVEQCTAARDRAQATHLQVTTSFGQQTEKARSELAELRAKRERLAPGVPPALLKTYDQMRERMQGLAIVMVSGSMCTNCKVTVPSASIQRVARGNEIIKCESCRRILYVPAK